MSIFILFRIILLEMNRCVISRYTLCGIYYTGHADPDGDHVRLPADARVGLAVPSYLGTHDHRSTCGNRRRCG